MTLKINYLDDQKSLSKNTALFLGKDAKISEFKGIFEDRTNLKLINLIKKLNKKMNIASKMLSTKNYNVNEVADKIGYSTSSHFINAFKNKFGTTPNKYLKSI